MSFDLNASDSADVVSLRAKVAELRGTCCSQCARPLCGHQTLFVIALGAVPDPRCLVCLAQAFGLPADQLRDQMFDHFMHRDCYRAVWRQESLREGYDVNSPPACLWNPSWGQSPAPLPSRPASALTGSDCPPEVCDDRWDAGTLGCGDLVLELRQRLRALPPRSILELIALDPGAPADIPAWCNLTGHTLLYSQPPHYWIRRKET